jgi:HEAT repeat protein
METRSLILSPEQYTQVSTYELLCAAEQGFVGLDHRFLHAVVDDPEKSIPDLVRFGLEEREGGRENLSPDLLQILRHLRTPKAIPVFLEDVRRNDLDASLPLINSLREIGEPAIEPLLEFYKETAGDDDSDAGFLLGSLGIRDPRILEALVERLQTDPMDAGHCLAAYGDPAAIPAMRAAIEAMKEDEWMIESLRHSLRELEAGRRPLEDEDEESFDLWELYPEDTDPRFDLLTAAETEMFLDSSDAENRFAAVSVLSEEDRPELWDRFLKMAREDPDLRVRNLSWRALVSGWDRPDIRAAMKACLADESASPEERCGAMQSLAARENTDELRRQIMDFYNQPDTRAEAIEAMAVTFDPRFEKYFSKHLGDPDLNVCTQAILGIGLLQLESEAPRLVPYFNDDDLRASAIPAYAMCAPCEPTRAGFRRLLQKIDKLAGGLEAEDEMGIKEALNARAAREEMDPIFGPDGEALIDEPVVATVKTGRNDPCPCGSGKKYKKCCGSN